VLEEEVVELVELVLEVLVELVELGLVELVVGLEVLVELVELEVAAQVQHVQPIVWNGVELVSVLMRNTNTTWRKTVRVLVK